MNRRRDWWNISNQFLDLFQKIFKQLFIKFRILSFYLYSNDKCIFIACEEHSYQDKNKSLSKWSNSFLSTELLIQQLNEKIKKNRFEMIINCLNIWVWNTIIIQTTTFSFSSYSCVILFSFSIWVSSDVMKLHNKSVSIDKTNFIKSGKRTRINQRKNILCICIIIRKGMYLSFNIISLPVA